MYNPSLLKPYLKTKYDNNIEVKNKELYLLCSCEIDNQKSSVRALKSKFLKEFKNASYGETNGETNDESFKKKSNDYTNKPSKVQFHDQLIISHSNRSRTEIRKSHLLSLLKKYYELPLFIYSKIFERVNKEYKIISNIPMTEKDTYDTRFNQLTYSFYDICIELFNEIDQGKYNQEIEEYMKDILQSYGETYCNEMFKLPFDKDKLEEVTYWSEEEAKEYIDKIINIEHPKDAIEYNWTEEKLRKCNEWAIEHGKNMVEEGSYIEDYSNVVKEVSEVIADTIHRIPQTISLFENDGIDINPTTIRVILLIFLMFEYRSYNIFDERPNEYIRGDLLKLYIEMNRNKIPLGYIPCSIDYQDNITNIYDIYREYDTRWFGMNDPERFLQYTEDPTKEVETEDQEEDQYDPPIPELEFELNRLKEDNREI